MREQWKEDSNTQMLKFLELPESRITLHLQCPWQPGLLWLLFQDFYEWDATCKINPPHWPWWIGFPLFSKQRVKLRWVWGESRAEPTQLLYFWLNVSFPNSRPDRQRWGMLSEEASPLRMQQVFTLAVCLLFSLSTVSPTMPALATFLPCLVDCLTSLPTKEKEADRYLHPTLGSPVILGGWRIPSYLLWFLRILLRSFISKKISFVPKQW